MPKVPLTRDKRTVHMQALARAMVCGNVYESKAAGEALRWRCSREWKKKHMQLLCHGVSFNVGVHVIDGTNERRL